MNVSGRSTRSRCPQGLDDAAVRKHLLQQFNIEIGAGLGPLAGKVFRIGLMGTSSSPELVDLLVRSLGEAITAQKSPKA